MGKGSGILNKEKSFIMMSDISITPELKHPSKTKKNSTVYEKPSGLSTDRSYNLNRDSSFNKIFNVNSENSHSRKGNKRDLNNIFKSKVSTSSNSRILNKSQVQNNKIVYDDKAIEHQSFEKLEESVKFLKNENKQLISMSKQTEKIYANKIKDWK